ncbi:hypothetical protein HHL22_07715 [Hymenobacter sp. RP-2-7]|uniref:Glycosyltransferase RgtA/B/C/D-like domain-containing protein n=1 Tax=Hymenobacter polaris TaxID=2682546 RepID=A0A7Y0AD42_9BACT|nr:DUF6056 family protein [Hymenobacter polaris]NML65091.1 hypothetical protein [Hymenobacter polaris]
MPFRVRSAGRLLLAAGLLAALLPFFLLCYYNQPYLDDFALGTLGRTRGPWAAQAYLYAHLYGRFVASFLLVVGNPLTYGALRAYGLASLVINLCTLLALWFSLRSLLRPALSRLTTLLLAGALLLFFIALIPDIYASFYWFAAQVTHHLAALYLLLVVVGAVRFQQATRRAPKLAWLSLAVIGTLCTGGSSEPATVLLGWLLLVAGGISWQRWQGAALRLWAGLLGLLAGAAWLNATAPGTQQRLHATASGARNMAPLLASFWHPAWLAGALGRLLFTPGVLLLLLAPLALQPLVPALVAARPRGLRLPLPFGAAVLLVGILLGALLMQVQIESPAISSRVANLLLWWLLLGWLGACWAALPAAASQRRPVPKLVRYAIGALLVLYVLLPVRRAWREVAIEAPSWYEQCWQRYAFLQRLALTTPHVRAQVPPIRRVVPRYVLIRGYDIGTTYNRPYNRDVAAYFGVDSVRVDPAAQHAAF